jgi:hypothetical protein
MNWWQLLVSIGSIIAFWFLIHRENQSILRDIAKEQKDFQLSLKDEIKDFHGRLCTLEQKYISMMEKHIERLGK